MKNKDKRIEISKEIDISEAAHEAMIIAEKAGFSRAKQMMVAAAVSELSRNIFCYALKGEITLRLIENKNHKGVEVVAEDKGPGIANIDDAMKDHYSTSDSLGLGLPGVKRMMDEFMLDTKIGVGTRITTRKWG